MRYKLYIPIYIVGFLVFLTSVTGCIREDKYNNSPQGNFDALWQIIDEQYCYLDYKGIDWDAIYTEYNKRITSDMSREGLFEVLGDMLAELKDGHVNLSSAFNVARYWKWYEDYPRNFNETIQEKNYLGTDYRIGSGIKYTILEDNIAYLYYGSFSDAIGEGNLSEILQYVAICNGMIIDVRNNGGGYAHQLQYLSGKVCQRQDTHRIHHAQNRKGTQRLLRSGTDLPLPFQQHPLAEKGSDTYQPPFVQCYQ